MSSKYGKRCFLRGPDASCGVRFPTWTSLWNSMKFPEIIQNTTIDDGLNLWRTTTFVQIIRNHTIKHIYIRIWRRAAFCCGYSHDSAFVLNEVITFNFTITDFDQLQEAAVWIRHNFIQFPTISRAKKRNFKKWGKHPVWVTMLRLGLWQAPVVKRARKRCGWCFSLCFNVEHELAQN